MNTLQYPHHGACGRHLESAVKLVAKASARVFVRVSPMLIVRTARADTVCVTVLTLRKINAPATNNAVNVST